MRKIRVLVVDDAVVVRRLLTDVLSKDTSIEVVGTAANGRIALAKIPQVNPDLITLDVEMPEMDGLQTLAAIRKTYATLPVIMFSTLTERGAGITLDALTMGANDYVTKPANVGSVTIAMQRISDELIPKIKALCAGVIDRHDAPPLSKHIRQPVKARSAVGFVAASPPEQRVDVLAIGVSTGGPNALAALIPQLPADFPVPIVIVQHMPPLFTRLLAERLTAKSAIRIDEGVDGAVLEPAHAWIAPGDYHMILQCHGNRIQVQLHQGPPVNSCRPAVDVLFSSVTEIYGAHTLAVVLTGMGQDGLRGCEEIRQAGGQILVQDEATSVVWGMPGFVARAGLADNILPLNQLAVDITRRVRAGRESLLTSQR